MKQCKLLSFGLVLPLICIFVLTLFAHSQQSRGESDLELVFQEDLSETFSTCEGIEKFRHSLRKFRDESYLCHSFLNRENQSHSPLRIAIWGDSQAQQLLPGLAHALSSSEEVTYFMEIDVLSPRLLNQVKLGDFTTVVVSTLFREFENEELASLASTVSGLHEENKNLVIVGATPFSPLDPRACTNPPILRLRDPCSFKKPSDEALQKFSRLVQNFAGKSHITVDLANVFCHDDVCGLVDEKNELLYRDSQHLTFLGSEKAGARISSLLMLGSTASR